MRPTQIRRPEQSKGSRLDRVRDLGGWGAAAGGLIACYLAAQMLVITRLANGPTLDEAIYLTAGRRTLEGHGVTDGYLSWFAGSLLWPVLAALGDSVADLAGARSLAALFLCVALFAVWRATVILFGERAAFFATALAVATGPVIALGHLAVIDAPAVAGLAVAFWATAELAQRNHREWLVLAACALAVAVLSKYPTAAAALPIVALILLLRGRAGVTDLAVLALLISAIFLVYFLSARGQLAEFLSWRVENNPSFGVTREAVAFSQVWYGGLPFVLAVGGWLVCHRKWLATTLLLGGLIFPAYHVLTANSVGDSKHIVFGMIFTLPLAGRLLDGIADESGALLATLMAVAAGLFGVYQAGRLDRGWADVRPAADYLATHARPGQRFLVNDSWPFTRRLYETGKIDSPWQVYDPYRVRHGQLDASVCRIDWFVVAQGAGRWPRQMRKRISACGTFRRVYRERVPVTSVGNDIGLVTWKAGISIYRNVRRNLAG